MIIETLHAYIEQHPRGIISNRPLFSTRFLGMLRTFAKLALQFQLEPNIKFTWAKVDT